MAFAIRHRFLRRSSTCPICQKLFRQVTTIAGCYHRFCYKCITKKIIEEGLHNCPDCNLDLGPKPLQRLSVDYHRQRDCRSGSDDEVGKERARASEFAKERAKAAKFAKQATIENQQRPIALALPSQSQRMRGAGRRPPPTKNVVNTNATSTQSRRRQGAENASFRGPPNLTHHHVQQEAFWFSLVASHNQKCRAPLKQIPARYLRVKDGNITVSCIRKYLMQKLNLRSETEVEISLQGHVIVGDLQIRNVVDLWLKTRAPSEKREASVGSSAGEFVLVLTYARKPMAASK